MSYPGSEEERSYRALRTAARTVASTRRYGTAAAQQRAREGQRAVVTQRTALVESLRRQEAAPSFLDRMAEMLGGAGRTLALVAGGGLVLLYLFKEQITAQRRRSEQ